MTSLVQIDLLSVTGYTRQQNILTGYINSIQTTTSLDLDRIGSNCFTDISGTFIKDLIPKGIFDPIKQLVVSDGV